jgi:hypothetical protein
MLDKLRLSISTMFPSFGFADKTQRFLVIRTQALNEFQVNAKCVLAVVSGRAAALRTTVSIIINCFRSVLIRSVLITSGCSGNLRVCLEVEIG